MHRLMARTITMSRAFAPADCRSAVLVSANASDRSEPGSYRLLIPRTTSVQQEAFRETERGERLSTRTKSPSTRKGCLNQYYR